MTTTFCIEATAARELISREPMVFYRVWRGRRPPSMLRWLLAMGARRPEFTSTHLETCQKWVANYHEAERTAAAFNAAPASA